MNPYMLRNRLTIAVDGRELKTRGSTGIGRYLLNFLDSDARRRSRHRFVVLGDASTPADAAAGARCITVPGGPGRLWDQIALPRALRRLRADVFFSPYDKAPFCAPCPVVATFHDLLFLRVPHLAWPWSDLYGLSYALERRALGRRLSAVLTVSDYSRREIGRVLRYPASRIRIAANGIADRFRPVEDPSAIRRIRERYGIPEGYLLYLGNFKPHKNVGALLQAYEVLPESLRRRHALVLAGRLDAHGRRLQSRAAELESVRMPGPVSDDDLPALYSGAAVFLYPSLEEGFGLPPLEAMACGVPVIAANAASLPGVLGDAALLVDPRPDALAFAVERLLADDGLRARLVEAGRRRAGVFTVDRSARSILSVLEEAAAKGRTL